MSEELGAETRALCAARGPALLALARASLAWGARHGHLGGLERARYEGTGLEAPGACFVTLRAAGALRGCIGSLEARRALAEDAWGNAYAAAREDPRFPPVGPEEVADLRISLSVLGPLAPMEFGDEADLLAQLRPGQDGLLIRDGRRGATYLPSVWEALPRPADFLRELKRKAGLPAAPASGHLRAWRYVTVAVRE